MGNPSQTKVASIGSNDLISFSRTHAWSEDIAEFYSHVWAIDAARGKAGKDSEAIPWLDSD